jgi:hypothetical protein
VYACRSTDTKFVDAKRVIRSHNIEGQAMQWPNEKDKIINSGLQKNYTEN